MNGRDDESLLSPSCDRFPAEAASSTPGVQARRANRPSVLVALATSFVISVAAATTNADGQVVLSEFLAANANSDRDEFSRTSDWIELANIGSEAVELEGWALSNDSAHRSRWVFPARRLDPGGYLVVRASGRDERSEDPNGELHADFRLRARGEALALLRPDGSVADEFAPRYPPQFPNVSFGRDREPTGRTEPLSYYATPTPGAPNSSSDQDSGPLLLGLDHTPAVPSDDDDLTITIRVDPRGRPAASVTLHYRVLFGDETETAMFDDGEHGDGRPGDGVYGARIPANAAGPGELVRYFVSATTRPAAAAQPEAPGDAPRRSRLPIVPIRRDASGDDRAVERGPRYRGTVVEDPSIDSEIAVFHWFAKDAEWFQNPLLERFTRGRNNRSRASTVLFYDGLLYDDVDVNVRGATSTGWRAPKFKFRFHDGYEFRYSRDAARVGSFNLDPSFVDPSYVRLPLAFEVFARAGALASSCFPVHTRMNGSFYRLSFFIETPGSSLVDRYGWPEDSSVYKAEGDMRGIALLPRAHVGTTKGMQKARPPWNRSRGDLRALIRGVDPDSPTRGEYLFDHLDLPEVISALAAYTVTKHYDNACHNYYLARHDGRDEWCLLPWDLDLVFDRLEHGIFGRTFDGHPFTGGTKRPTWTPQHWNRLYEAVYADPIVSQMYLRRVRTLMDEVLGAPDVPAEERWVDRRARELAGQVAEEARADFERWDVLRGGPLGQPGPPPSGLEHLLELIDRHRRYLYGLEMIPAPQPWRPRLVIARRQTDGQADDYLEIRNDEGVAIDLTGFRLTGDEGATHEFAPGTVIAAGRSLFVAPDAVLFRARSESPRGGEGHLVQRGDEDLVRANSLRLDVEFRTAPAN